MLKNISKLECKIAEKIFQFLCDQDSSLSHVKEALFQFLKYIGQIEDAIKTNQEKSNTENLPESNELVENLKEETKIEAIQ